MKPKFTLEDEFPDFRHDPSPSSASSSTVSVRSPADLDFAESTTPVPLSSVSDNAMMLAPRPPRRRWTLAMAMTDEGVTDEALVQALEQFRLQPRTSSKQQQQQQQYSRRCRRKQAAAAADCSMGRGSGHLELGPSNGRATTSSSTKHIGTTTTTTTATTATTERGRS